jgi:transposase InsO family protein
LRVTRRWGPARIGYHLGLHPSTVHRVLSRHRLARLAWLDRATGQVVRRYERQRPGELVHLDVKKLGKIPNGGGWRMLGRAEGKRNRHRTHPGRSPKIGNHFLHSAIDDHSRLAYSELLTDETKETAAAFWTRANAYFARCGITVERVLTDNGSCYRSKTFAAALGDKINHKRTQPYRPQTNGKVERFHRTLADEWAYARLYRSDSERCDAFPTWLHTYNHHRGHTALGGLPPASRVPNLSGQYT